MSEYTPSNLLSVEGQVVVVTGGGTGLGKIIAHAFATNNAKVYISGRRLGVLEAAAKEISSDPAVKGEVIPVQADISNKAGCAALASAIATKETRLDTLVNCAGVLRHWKQKGDINDPDDTEALLNSLEDDDFNYTNSINISGTYFTTVAFLPLLRKSDKANVINIASIAALHIGRKVGTITYGVSKAGAVALSAHLAGRLTPLKIRVNCVCPGMFPSEMTDSFAPGALEATVKTIPAGRLGYAQEIAGPCILLASPAGGYMNNAQLVVDGGRLMTISINS